MVEHGGELFEGVELFGVPDLLTGTELSLVAEVGKGASRWQQVHFNKEIVRQFFNLEPGGDDRQITLEKLSGSGRVTSRVAKRLVYAADSNKNLKIEFNFGSADLAYPPDPERPLLVVVESAHLTYRYRPLMPNDDGHGRIKQLIAAGPSIGKGVHRRIVTLDEIEAYWPQAALRGGI